MPHLFVYGTLHPDRAPAEIAGVVQRMTLVGRGSVQGRVLDLGEYPGLIASEDAGECVPGTVFCLPDDPAVLSALDEYECMDPLKPAQGLFRREERTVTLDTGGQKQCWVYLYNPGQRFG